jgi:Tat protein translocase TatB subunit
MDNILGIGLPELFFIAIIALIILGPERLPGTLRQIAKYWGYARNLGRELTSQFSEEFKALEDLNPRKILNEMADEELAKDLNIKNVATTKKPAPKTTTSAAKSTTATKPATSTNKPAGATKSSTAKSPTAAKSTATAKTTGGKTATTKRDAAEQAPATPAPNQILPPVADEVASSANSDNSTRPQPASAENIADEKPAEGKPVVASSTAAVNGASDLAEHER